MQVIVERLQPSRGGHLHLIPNINRSGRVLPETVSAQELRDNPKTDRESPVRKLRDAEIYSILIDVSGAELAAHTPLAVELHFAAHLFRVLDASGRPLKDGERPPVRIDLAQAARTSTKVRGIQFFLEAQTYWGSPLLAADAPRGVRFRFLDGAGQVVADQEGFQGRDIRTADLILLGDDATPERIFVCDVGENQPSVRELADGARKAGVPLTVVPIDVNLGDSWLQDQFQAGYTATTGGRQQVIVHLPRMVNDAALVPGTPNLRNFTDTYFPSDGVGVMKDFWQLQIAVGDGTVAVELGVAESFPLFKQLVGAVRLLNGMYSLMRKIDRHANPRVPGGDLTDLYQVRLAIDAAHLRLLGERRANASQMRRILALRGLIDDLSQVLARDRDEVGLTVPTRGGEKRLVFDAGNSERLRDFFRELRDLHSPRNYGGNIEVSPPHGDAPYGKILTGSVSSKALRELLTSRGSRHPLASVYTGWLEVGHIDEVMSFVSSGTDRFAVLRAAPRLAMKLLERAVASQQQGKLVTRLFRGKKWIHEGKAGSPDTHRPPGVYTLLAGSGARYDLAGLRTRVDRSVASPYGHAAFHDDRQFFVLSERRTVDARYAAFVPCADLLAACRPTNRAVDALFLDKDNYRFADELSYQPYYDSEAYREEALPYKLDTVLASELPGVAVHPVPVLFDRVDDFFHNATSAVIPNLVNLQALGRHLLVPRPHGPRMRVADALDFMADWPEREGGPRVKPDVNFIRSRGLDRTWHWTRAGERVSRAALGRWPTELDPEFEEMMGSDAIAVAASTTKFEVASIYRLLHSHDPFANHPIAETEGLFRIAGYFKDGFDEFKNFPVDYCEGDTAEAHPRQDEYEAEIQKVMERIRRANPNVFDREGGIVSRDWIRLEIPEDTVDLFELYTELQLESIGMRVHWVDAWYYHTHFGGIHCGTNVLRRR